jgi:hypothetical protein
VDRAPKPGRSKFRPLISLFSIPVGIFTVLSYYTPNKLLTMAGFFLIAYITDDRFKPIRQAFVPVPPIDEVQLMLPALYQFPRNCRANYPSPANKQNFHAQNPPKINFVYIL